MRNLLPFLICCMTAAGSMAQSTANKDSSKPASTLVGMAKGNFQNTTQPDLVIYPNPAKNKITIQVKHFDPGMASVKLLDVKGKLVREDNRLITNGTEDIIMFLMLKAGIYFILVTEPGKSARKKLVML